MFAEMLKYLRDNNISIDLETMNPVEMKTKAAEKVAAMFPYPSASLMAKRSLGSRPTPSAYVNAMLVSGGRRMNYGYNNLKH